MNIQDAINALRVDIPSRPTRDQRIIALYQDPAGYSLRAVAEMVGLHHGWVRLILLKHGVELRRPHRNIHSRKGKPRSNRQ